MPTTASGWLCRFGEVRALDFRGHGGSAGGSGVGGDPEVLDVDAAVRSARSGVAKVVGQRRIESHNEMMLESTRVTR